MNADITFHSGWWYDRGFSFTEKFFLDADYRMKIDCEMRRVLYDNYGDYGLGEKNPSLRPLMDSDLLAGEYLQAQLLGCDVQFSEKDLPYTHPLNLNRKQLFELQKKNILESKLWGCYEKQFESLYSCFGKVESYIDMHGVQNLGLDLCGTELYEDYYLDEEFARQTLELSYRTIAEVARQIRRYSTQTSIGVTAIIRKIDPELYVTSNCSCELISEEIYEKYLYEHDVKLAKEFSPFGIHHCGQTMEHIARAYSKIKPEFVEIGALSDIVKVLQYFDKGTAINMRYSPKEMLEEKATDIRSKVIQMSASAKEFKKRSISCVGVDSKTKPENVEAFLEAAIEEAE